jgi:4-oxalocrotonate tautomerase
VLFETHPKLSSQASLGQTNVMFYKQFKMIVVLRFYVEKHGRIFIMIDHSYLGRYADDADNRRLKMPYINIKITKEGATAEQKEQLIAGATQLLVDVLGKNPKTTVVVIDEVDTDNWGIGGEVVTKIRNKQN